MASIAESFYAHSPVHVIDQNRWDEHGQISELALMTMLNSVYTPLVSWKDHTQAQTVWETELLPNDVSAEPIPFTANYVTPRQPFDSMQRKWTVNRYGDVTQVHKSDNYFNQWRQNRADWRPLLRGVLGNNILRQFELLSRNVFLSGPSKYWKYAGGRANLGAIIGGDKFDLSAVNGWKLRLGSYGSPFIPGAAANAKLAMIPPGAIYDFFEALPTAAGNETALWKDAVLYGDQTPLLRYELGQYKGIRFVEPPSDRFGFNPNVLYNCGAISFQYAVTQPIKSGDGAPDPETTAVDGYVYVGQKNVTHYIQLEAFGSTDFAEDDIVTIHISRSDAYGVTDGISPIDTLKLERRVVAVDAVNYRLSFDRPIMWDFINAFDGKSATGNAQGTYYAYVTKGRHIGFCLVLGSTEGVQGRTYQAPEFHEPRPFDHFESVWTAAWDAILGWNIADPNLWIPYFCAVSVPTPSGIIVP